MNSPRITLNGEQLDLLDDVLQYYVMSDFGGGDHAAPADQAALRTIQARVAAARERLAQAGVNLGHAV